MEPSVLTGLQRVPILADASKRDDPTPSSQEPYGHCFEICVMKSRAAQADGKEQPEKETSFSFELV